MRNRFTRTLLATAADIDELGHVNNAVWVRWVQDIATAHWRTVADPAHAARYVWVVTRHEIDYHGNVGDGATVRAETWIPDRPRGARFDRCVAFRGDGDRVLVSVRSTWVMIDRETGRLQRIPAAVAAPFLAGG